MNKLCAFALAATGIVGCSTTTCPDAGNNKTDACRASCVSQPAYGTLAAEQKLQRITQELHAIGVAMQKYAWDHEGRFPPRLSHLVAQGYLPAKGLVSSADPSGGKEGGVPDAYSEWGQAKETDEPGSSYLYEFSEAVCQWDWKSYLGGKPSQSDVDSNRDGTVTWAEAKSWQLTHGDTTQQPTSRAYAKHRFPIVRCYWYDYPNAGATPESRCTVNLSVELQTVFVAQPWWEKARP
jgi:hypothetical protein